MGFPPPPPPPPPPLIPPISSATAAAAAAAPHLSAAARPQCFTPAVTGFPAPAASHAALDLEDDDFFEVSLDMWIVLS